MSAVISISLQTNAAQAERLHALQLQFANACNTISPVVQEHRCWNRVALHHLVYKQLRTKFPALGSQMACNVIYSVCRTARTIYTHPKSPWAASADNTKNKLPLLRFSPSFPVFFDRHTLSLNHGKLSLFTLDGRMRFQLGLDATSEARFKTEKLKEIVLKQKPDHGFVLEFYFGSELDASTDKNKAELPEYLLINAPAGSKESVLVAASATPYTR